VRASVTPARIRNYSAHTAVWLFVHDPATPDEGEREDLATFCQASTTLKRAYRLMQECLTMVHKREGHRLDAWLAKIAESDLPELQSCAGGESRKTKPQ
jgi:hypothetical protein